MEWHAVTQPQPQQGASVRCASPESGCFCVSQVVALAATTGAAVHICHALSTGRYAGQSGWDDMVGMVAGANSLSGVDISLEQVGRRPSLARIFGCFILFCFADDRAPLVPDAPNPHSPQRTVPSQGPS